MPITVFFLLVTLVTFGYRAGSRNGYGPLVVGLLSSLSIVIGKFFLDLDPLVYGGAAALFLASIWNAFPARRAGRGLTGPPGTAGRT